MPILYYHTIFFYVFKTRLPVIWWSCCTFGIFHQTCVKQLNWLDDAEYAQLVALAQILPGPTSSQVGLAIGYVKKAITALFWHG